MRPLLRLVRLLLSLLMFDVAVHLGLELSGQGVWACLRGRCNCKSHRIVGDGLLTLMLAVLTVHLVG